MRMLKKLLLAGAFIGVLGSFGFAQEAKADDKMTVSFANDTVTVNIDNAVSINKVVLSLEGVTIADLNVSENKAELSGLRSTVNATTMTGTGNTLKTLKAVGISSSDEKKWDEQTYTLPAALYKLTVSASPTYGGSVMIDSGASAASASIYDYTVSNGGNAHKLTALPALGSKYAFSGWTGAVTTTTNPLDSIYVSEGGSSYTANFASTSYGQAILNAKYKGTTYTSVETALITMNKGETITFSYNKPTGSSGSASIYVDQDDTYLSKTSSTQTSVTYTAVKAIPEDGFLPSVTAVASSLADFEDSDSIEIDIEPASVGERVNLSDFKDYITEGYTLQFKAKAADDSVNLANQTSTIVISEGSDYVDSIEKTENTSDKNVTFKIKFKGEKLDKGTNSKDVKFKILINGVGGAECTIDSDTDKEKKVTVYSNPTNSYNNSDRTMSYKVPAKVNTGTETGKDSNLSYTQDTVSEVKGIRINVLLNDSILGTTTTAAGKGTSATVDASTMESIITNLGNSGKFTGDCTVAFRAYPSDGSGNCNKKVYHETYAKVYKVILRPGQTATAGSKTASAYALPIAMIAQRNTGATTTATTTTAAGKEYVLYGLEGQTLTAPSGVTDIVDVNGNPVTKIVVNADSSKNVYTYGTAAATKEGLDRVPKTGQSNVFVYVMAVVVCGAVGYGLYAYNKKSKKSI